MCQELHEPSTQDLLITQRGQTNWSIRSTSESGRLTQAGWYQSSHLRGIKTSLRAGIFTYLSHAIMTLSSSYLVLQTQYNRLSSSCSWAGSTIVILGWSSGAGVSTCLDSERDLASLSLTFLVASPFFLDLDALAFTAAANAVAADLFDPAAGFLDLDEPDFELEVPAGFKGRG